MTSALPRSVGVRVALEVVAQQRLELRLVEHVGLREADDAAARCHAGTRQAPASRCPAAAVRARVGRSRRTRRRCPAARRCGRSRRRDARRAAAGTRRPIGPARGVDAVLREQRRRSDAGRSRADDDDGNACGTERHAYLTAVRWVPRSMAPSSVATTEFHDVAVAKVLGVVGLPLEERLPLHRRAAAGCR